MTGRRCQLIDVLRGLTILWITAFHFYMDTRGGAGPVTLALFVKAFEARDWGGMLDISARTLIALPSYRLDVLLFVTGVVLMLSRPASPIAFWRSRARAVLPNYWLGTLAATILLIALAGLRSGLKGTELSAEIAGGTLLARTPYHFEWADVARSVSIVGRLESTRTMQVMAPSLWYVILILQLYLAFPLLRWLLNRVGPVWFVAICTAIMFGGRSLVFAGWIWPGFDLASTLLYVLPLRLFGPALGMVTARWIERVSAPPPRRASMVLIVPALGAILCSIWIGADTNRVSLSGPALPLLMGLPALWVVASASLHMRRTTAILTWVGMHSLSVLVVQDLLRLVTGTTIALWGRLDPLTWYLLPAYLAVTVGLTPLWHTVPSAAAARFGGPG